MASVVSDELCIGRLPARERIAIAQITGTVENATLHHGQSVGEAAARINGFCAPFGPDRKRLLLAHAAASYVEGEFDFERACVDLLCGVGADVDLATRIAIRWAFRPGFDPDPDRARRLRSLATVERWR